MGKATGRTCCSTSRCLQPPTRYGSEHAIDKFGPDGVENDHLVLAFTELPVVVGPELRVVLDGRGGGVAQQGLHLLVGQVAHAGLASDAAARAVLEGSHPGVAGELPAVLEGREALGVDQEGRSGDQADADDRLGQPEALEELLILFDGGLHLLLDLGDLLLDELDLILGKA